MAISSIGVGSGLPLGELLASLRSAEETKLVGIEARKEKEEARFTGYGQLKNELESFAKAASALSGAAFKTLKTTVTGADFKATALDGAIMASYEIAVTSLAKSQSLVAKGIAGEKGDQIGAGGTIELTINGEVKSIELTAGSSLNDVVKAINENSDLNLSASIINNGSDTPLQLMISSKVTGTEAAITKIEVQGNTQLNDVMKFGVAGSTVTESAATDARVNVNGVDILSQTNTISGALENVTLTLTGKSGSTGSLVIEQDVDAISKSVQDFVDRYNDVHKKIQQLTKYDIEAKSGGALVGDSLARSVQNKMATILNTVSDGPFAMLGNIGIRTDDNGLLTVNKTELADAINSDPNGVKSLFQGENGVSTRSETVAKLFTDSKSGSLVNATKGAESAIESFDEQYQKAVERIDAQMEIHRKRFTAMDALVAQMNSTSAYLSQQLASLGKSNQ